MTAAGAGRARRAYVVVDLGFGDAGKGLLTDYLVRATGAHTVVRSNGGAQAGHNVVAPDGRHHTFAQFGAGSFVPGVRTLLTRDVVVHPTALLVEAGRLAALGVGRPLERLAVSGEALVVTPYHQAACRLRELARGAGRHGSCGVGVGEATADAVADAAGALRVGALCGDRAALVRALERVRARKRAELDGALRALAGRPEAEAERRVLEGADVAGAWAEAAAAFAARVEVVDERAVAARLAAPGALVFEGAQGALLDEGRGFFPHVTRGTCTFANPLALLRQHGYAGEITRLGVLRSYATRHGAGPLPTEAAALAPFVPEPHNGDGPWQGAFRVGWPDLVLARYALEVCGGADALAITHLDALGRAPTWRVCAAYRAPPRPFFEAGPDGLIVRLRPPPPDDLAGRAAFTRALGEVVPAYEALGGAPDAEAYARAVGARLGVAVRFGSWGPSAADVCAFGTTRA
jgi:adenylosuccinate synthase